MLPGALIDSVPPEPIVVWPLPLIVPPVQVDAPVNVTFPLPPSVPARQIQAADGGRVVEVRGPARDVDRTGDGRTVDIRVPPLTSDGITGGELAVEGVVPA